LALTRREWDDRLQCLLRPDPAADSRGVRLWGWDVLDLLG